MAKVVIFGVLDTAQLAKYYLDTDSEHEVVAFCLSKAYLKDDTFEGLPVVPFEDVEEHYPPSDYALFIPMTASKMNHNRRSLYETGKSKGYEFISYISSKATVLQTALEKLLHLKTTPSNHSLRLETTSYCGRKSHWTSFYDSRPRIFHLAHCFVRTLHST